MYFIGIVYVWEKKHLSWAAHLIYDTHRSGGTVALVRT